VGWGLGRESWGIHYAVFAGDTSTPSPWHLLDAFLAREWQRADGRAFGLWCACIDSGGHRTTEVYQFCRERLVRNIFPVKGRAGAGLPFAGKPTTANQFRVPLYPVGADTAKEALFSRLSLTEPGPGYCHFPRALATGYDGEYFRGLLSERRVIKIRAGRRLAVWKQVHPRNEPLDARNYATAAMEILSPDFAALAVAVAPAVSPETSAPRAKGRRIYSRGVSY
jgi:phage terminase large subunit GpA-like protein